MKPTRDQIRRRLGLREVPKPPEDLARRIKAEIPASFRYRDHVSAGRKGDLATAASWGLSWQVAASFLALTIIGVGAYMVTYESQQSATPAAAIAEADGQTAMEFTPPTAASSPAPARAAEPSKLKSNEVGTKLDSAYDIAQPPPPPPEARMQDAETGLAGGIEGGSVGGVLGGVIGEGIESTAVDLDDSRAEKPSEERVARARDRGFAQEKESLAAPAAPAPAVMAEQGRRDAKAEPARGMGATQSTVTRPASPAQSQLLGKDKAGDYAPLRVGGDVKAPVIIERVEIVYPPAARAAQIQGIVIIEAIIDRNGNVKDARVLKPLPLGLDEAALKAVKQWKFKPGTLHGQPVDVIFIVTVNRTLAR